MKVYDVNLDFKDISFEEQKEIMKIYFKIMTQTKGKCWSSTNEKIIEK